MSGLRIVPPLEAVAALAFGQEADIAAALAHTAAVLGEQRDAALALHEGRHYCQDEYGGSNLYYPSDANYPCPTARALGVTL